MSFPILYNHVKENVSCSPKSILPFSSITRPLIFFWVSWPPGIRMVSQPPPCRSSMWLRDWWDVVGNAWNFSVASQREGMCVLDTISTSLLVVMRTWYKPFCMVREEKHLRQARIWIPFTLEPQSSCHRLCHMRKKNTPQSYLRHYYLRGPCY